MKALDSTLLKKFLEVSVDRLKGEWLLVGGTLLPAVGIEVRATVDIDLIGLGSVENAQTLQLMELAEALEIPIESVNQAAAYFLHKVGYSKIDLIPLMQRKKCTIFRPSLPLYWKLKAGRLSETDLEDCRHYLKYCLKQGDRFDPAQLKKWLSQAMKQKPTQSRLERLRSLKTLL